MLPHSNRLTKSELDNGAQPDEVEREETGSQIPVRLRWAISHKKQPTLLGHIVLTTSLAIFAIAGYWGLFWFAETRETEWLGTVPQTPIERINTAVNQLPATPAERSRLVEQFQEIEIRAARHADIMSFFYKQYYISISMVVAAVVVGSICLFFISKAGWDRVNNALINIFISASAIILFHGNLMLVFKQEENLKSNQELYLSYISLREEILSYWATQQISTDESIDPAYFIHYLDSKLQTLNKIQLGFDSPQISTFVDQFKQLESSDNYPFLQPSPQP